MLNQKLKDYIEINILPEYTKNDSGHGIEHINYVIDRCFRFAKQFDNIDLDMLYTVAVFHDIAHHIDKKNHEILSAKIFYDNEDIKHFFTDEQRIVIKEAIEDHRASSDSVPRNNYGKIISSADRSTDVNEFLRRTHAYTLKHTPEATLEQMLIRAYNHTSDKYGDKGYAKHYVVDDEYNEFRNEISNLLSDRNLFNAKYLKTNNLI
ncbi:MAG: HD domain-containing protein [Ruminococcaceae bacterium]|nr:HD domain-containing protein [Oscillospiraceae bacterium]